MRPNRSCSITPPAGAAIRRPTQGRRTTTSRWTGPGFTLVEILVVVVILAILAMIVVPQFTSAAGETRDNALKMNLFRIRQQLEIYKQQHGGTWPTLHAFEAQMTRASNTSGETAAPGTAGYAFGPYLREIPSNPYTTSKTVGDGAVGTSAWYYNQDTGEFRANNSAEHREL